MKVVGIIFQSQTELLSRIDRTGFAGQFVSKRKFGDRLRSDGILYMQLISLV